MPKDIVACDLFGKPRLMISYGDFDRKSGVFPLAGAAGFFGATPSFSVHAELFRTPHGIPSRNPPDMVPRDRKPRGTQPAACRKAGVSLENPRPDSTSGPRRRSSPGCSGPMR
jgi:hypothetical protein